MKKTKKGNSSLMQKALIGVVILLIVLISVIFLSKDKEPKANDKLSSFVKVGDYVGYDAGNWNKEDNDSTHLSAVPSKQGQFGGIKAGSSKNDSTAETCYLNYHSSNSGWRVLNVKEGKVTLIHAGTPACYYHGLGDSYQQESVNLLNAFISEKFLNKTYAISARSAECGDFFKNGECEYASVGDLEDETMYAVGGYYWLSSTRVRVSLWFWSAYDEFFRGCNDHTLGIRPVVVLDSNVIWNGAGDGKTSDSSYQIAID